MVRARVSFTLWCAAFVAVNARGAQAPPPVPLRPALAAVLQNDLGFLAADLDAVRAGSVVARALATTDTREVAIAGAMHIAVSADYYVARITNVGAPSAGAAPPDAGSFSVPATAADLAEWSLTAGDLTALDLCDVRGCAFRLSDDVLSRLRPAAGATPGASGDAWRRGARQAVAGYVAAFQAHGPSGLPVYHNGNATITPGSDLPALLARFAFLNDRYVDLVQYLDRYPAGRSDRVAERFVWSLDMVLSTPVLSVTHLVVWPGPTPVADAALVSQELYTSREVDARVEITLVASDTTADQPGATIVTMSRSLATSLQGLLGAAKRPIARSKARAALAEFLTATRTAFERDARR